MVLISPYIMLLDIGTLLVRKQCIVLEFVCWKVVFDMILLLILD